MKFGVRLWGTDPESVVAKAVHAEQAGFESLWRGDHLLVPTTMESRYPYSATPGPPFRSDAPVLDVLTVLAFVAGATTTIRLATGVLVLPMRDVVAVARAAQSIDVLSGGRLTLGVGVGWLKEEFELLGRDFHQRGAITTEAVAVLRTLFDDAEPAFAGRHFHIGDVRFEPKPVQLPRLPIVAGGESEAALNRAAALCDGWYGHVSTPEQAERFVRSLRSRLQDAGRVADRFEVTVRVDPGLPRDAVKRYEDAGVDRLVAEIGSFDEPVGWDDLRLMTEFADRVIATG